MPEKTVTLLIGQIYPHYVAPKIKFGFYCYDSACQKTIWGPRIDLVSILYRKITDAPNRLKVNEVKPEAIVLWTLAHSYWVSAVLLLLALPLCFSEDCEILCKVTRQVESPFVNQIPILFIFSFLENYSSGYIFATYVLNSYENLDKQTTDFYSMLYEYPELMTY